MPHSDPIPHVLAVCQSRIASMVLAADLPFSALAAMGRIAYRSRILTEVSAGDLQWADLLFLVRPSSTQDLVLLRAFSTAGGHTLAYYDDDLLNPPATVRSADTLANPAVRASIRHVLHEADMVCTPSRLLAETLAAHRNEPIRILPVMAVDTSADPGKRSRSNLARSPIVGYAGSVDHTLSLNEFIVPVLVRLWEQDVRFTFHCIGPEVDVPARYRAFYLHSPHTNSYQDWLVLKATLDWDLALAILPDSSFHRCKFHNKFVEYATMGVPAIYSNVDPYREPIQDGETGWLVNNDIISWTESIRNCLADSTWREYVARRAWLEVQENHSRQVVLHGYQETLANLLITRPRRRSVGRINLTWQQYRAWRIKHENLRGLNRWRQLANDIFARMKKSTVC